MTNWQIIEMTMAGGKTVKMVTGTLDNGQPYVRPISPTLRLEHFARELEEVNSFQRDQLATLNDEMPEVIVDVHEVLVETDLLDR
jgi:hypothetical protein